MRKLAMILAASMVMSTGMAALAADPEYIRDGNKVDVNADISNYSTVLITKGIEPFSGDNSDIVYANQADSAFTASLFMLKAGADDGDYRILLGNADGESTSMTFNISSEEPSPDAVEMDPLDSESGEPGFINYAFTKEAVKLGQYDGIKIVVKDENNVEKTGGFRLDDILKTHLSQDASVNFGLQINNVPEGITIVSVSLDTITAGGSENAWN